MLKRTSFLLLIRIVLINPTISTNLYSIPEDKIIVGREQNELIKEFNNIVVDKNRSTNYLSSLLRNLDVEESDDNSNLNLAKKLTCFFV